MQSSVPKITISEPGSSALTKTGSWRTYMPVVDKEKCTACTICTNFCPEGVITVSKETKAEINFDYCKGCGLCAEVCPASAITMEREVK